MEDRYYELKEIVDKLDDLIDDITDKNYKEDLEIIKFQALEEAEELEPRLLAIREQEEREQEIEYERSVI